MENTTEQKRSILDTLPYILILLITFLVPLFVIPALTVPFAKVFVASMGTLVALLLWSVGRLREGMVALPRSIAVLGLLLLPLPFFLSAIFTASPYQSFFGAGFEMGTVVNITILTVLALLITAVVHTKSRMFNFYVIFIGSFFLVSLLQLIRLFSGGDTLSFGVFTNAAMNFVGKWNDLGIFFGIWAILAMAAIDFKIDGKAIRVLSWAALVISLFFLAVVHFLALWIVLALVAIVIAVYTMSIARSQKEGEATQPFFKTPPVAAVAVVVVSILFLIAGNSINDSLARRFNIVQIEVRPNWQSTIAVMKHSLNKNLLLGSGPNTFQKQWVEAKPADVNTSLFWNTDFDSGVGLIPTLFVTTGLLGALFWLFFFGSFIYAGARAIIAPIKDQWMRFFTVSSFLIALYLWTVSIIYVPGSAIFTLAFIFTGIFIGAVMKEKLITTLAILYSKEPRRNFAAVLVLMFFIIISASSGYLLSEKTVSLLNVSRGLAHLNGDGDLVKAESSLIKAVSTNSHSDDSMRLLAEFYIVKMNNIANNPGSNQETSRQEFQQALSDALNWSQQAVKIDPTDYQNYISLGRVYESVTVLSVEGAYENAKKNYEIARQLNPRSPAVVLVLARLEAARGNYDGANALIADALVLKPNYTDAVFLESQISVTRGDVPAAIASAEKAGILAPNDAVVFFQIGFLKYTNKDYRGAIEALERSVTLRNQYSNARYFLGLSYSKLGRVEEAIAQFEEIEKYNPDNAEVKLILSNLRQGKPPLTGAVEPATRDELPVSEE